ncbi:MAG: Fic family protein [Candidatus Omnitrophota bacterium]|jgi:Fic family protein
MTYIWEHKDWPLLTWDAATLLPLVSQARKSQGLLLAKVKNLGFELEGQAQADVLTEEVIKTSAIEGERLNRESVRSSVARHLGLPEAGLASETRSVDGLVEVLLDATGNYNKPLTSERLKGWQAALFPTGFSGFSKIRVGEWRGHAMRVVSGSVGREKVYFEAPPGEKVEKEMKRFLSWWNATLKTEEGLLRAGAAHFYFVAIHPFEDGNGRVARALTDMALAQDENLRVRYYSFSSRIMQERESYYRILESTSKSKNTDITGWLAWFLECYKRAIDDSEKIIGQVLDKARFWQIYGGLELNERQRKVVNRMLDAGKGGFLGGLTTRKYVSMAKVSRATAFREISDMLAKKILHQLPGKGRSVHYDLAWPPETPEAKDNSKR